MSIRHTCSCGAQIKLPDSASGRKAKCQTCGKIFRVPGPAESTSPGEPPPAPAAPAVQNPAGSDWLDEFAQTEASAAGEPVHLLDLSAPPDDEPVEARPSQPAATVRTDRDWIKDPIRSFWGDVANAFLFFLDTGNMAMFMVIIFVSIWSTLLGYAGLFGFIGQLIVYGYLCAFYMSTVLETASGEDRLPSVSISNIGEDLLLPLVRFVGTWLLVLLPAFIVMMVVLANPQGLTGNEKTDWSIVIGVALAGLAMWPVVVLGVAITGSLGGMLPHTAIRTVVSAPLPYLAVLFFLLISVGIQVLVPEIPRLLGLKQTIGLIVGTAILGMAASAYSTIVAMRIIGLFYRHYKHRFPWAAE